MAQYKCPKCGENIRTIGTSAGTDVKCRHCGENSTTTEDNFQA